MHAAMSHGNAVANARDAEFKSLSPAGVDSISNSFSEWPHVNMTRDEVGVRISNPNPRFLDPFFRDPSGVDQGSVWYSF